MIKICDYKICTGCGACANICPKQCIAMHVEDKLGHLYPVVNQKSCIDCKLCQKTCPALKPVSKQTPKVAYAGWDKNIEEQLSSTSGGAASAIGRYFIRQGGVVYGCTMKKGVVVCHEKATEEKDLIKFKGSKYVQSTTGMIYKDALEDLKHGKKVLFIGTPCQVAGMKSMAGKYNDNLYSIDIICHGVPSLNYLQNHVKSKVPDLKDLVVSFRDGNDMCLQLLQIPSNGSTKILYRSDLWRERYKDTYYNAFIDGFSYRYSCHLCKYASPQRCSDLTLGDFWGLGKNIPFHVKQGNGTSVLLPITSKGFELIEGIKNEFYLYERTVNEAVDGNPQLKGPNALAIRHRFFLRLLDVMNIDKAYALSTFDNRIRRKIGAIKNKILKKA